MSWQNLVFQKIEDVKADVEVLQAGGSTFVIPTGLVGDGVAEDHAAIQAAIDQVYEAGGGVVFLPEGTYKLGAAIEMKAKVIIRGDGRETTKITQGFDAAGSGIITSSGGTAPGSAAGTLSANAAAGDSTLTVDSTTGRSVGEYLLLGSTANFASLGTGPRGEVVRVKTIDSATQLTLWGAVRDSYTTAASASLQTLTFIEGLGLADLTISNPSPDTTTAGFVWWTAVRNFSIDNVAMEGCDGSGIRLAYCIDGIVDRSGFRDFTDNNGDSRNGYGVELQLATENVVVSNCTFRRLRHGVTTGVSSGTRGVPRSILVTGCIAEECTTAAFDTHPHASDITYSNCKAHNCLANGFQVRGQDCKIIGCDTDYCNAGVYVGTEAAGTVIRGGSFRRSVARGGSGGIGIQLVSTKRVSIDSVGVDGAALNCIYVDTTTDINIQRSRLFNPGQDGTPRPCINTNGVCTGIVVVGNHGGAYSVASQGALSTGAATSIVKFSTNASSCTAAMNTSEGLSAAAIDDTAGGNSVPMNLNAAGGILGINTATPSLLGGGTKGIHIRTTDGTVAEMHVGADTASSASAAYELEGRVASGQIRATWQCNSGGTVRFGSATNHSVEFRTNATARMTLSSTALTMAEGIDIGTGTTTGSSLGTSTTQKAGMHGARVVQRAGVDQAAVATTGATLTTPYGYTTAAQADAIVKLVNEIRATLVEKGIFKGAA